MKEVTITIKIKFDKELKTRTDVKRQEFDFKVHQKPTLLSGYQMLDVLDYIRLHYAHDIYFTDGQEPGKGCEEPKR